MALQPKKLIRQADGTLAETLDQQGLEQGQSELAPPPGAPPVTPAGAAGAGAGPDSAKMHGSSAQKQNALAQTVAAADDQSLQDRQVGAPKQQAPGATETATRAKELAGGLSTLGSYGARVQGLIKARLDQVESQSAAPAVNDEAVKTALAGAQPDKLAQAQQALTAYATSGSEADLAKIRDLFGADKLSAGGLERLYQGSPEELAGLGQKAQGAVTIGQLDLAGGGMDPGQLAQDLGVTPDALAAMTPEQFQQAVQDRLNQNMSSVAALQAEYRGASPERQAQILEQLRAADASGIAAAEASTSHLADQLSQAQNVKFAGRDFNIQDLLKSDKISQLIKNAASNPAALQQLQASEPDLAAWVTKNQASLKTFAEHNEIQRTALEATQAEATALTKDLTPELRTALKAAGVDVAAGTLTTEQLAGLKQSLQANPVYQAIQASPAVRTALQEHPELASTLKGLSAGDIQRLATVSAKVYADPALAKILSADPAKGMLDPSQMLTAGYAADAWAMLPGDLKARGILTKPDDLIWAVNNKDAVQSPDVQALMDSGTIATASALRQVVAHPQIVSSLKQVASEHQQADALLGGDLTNPATQSQMRNMLFGSPLDDAEQKDLIAASEAWRMRTGPGAGSKINNGYLALRSVYDLNNDGRISAEDFAPGLIAARLRDAAGSLPDNTKLLAGDGSFIDPFTQAREALARIAPTMRVAAGTASREAAAAADREAQRVAAIKAIQDKIAADDLAAKTAAALGPAATPAAAAAPSGGAAKQGIGDKVAGGVDSGTNKILGGANLPGGNAGSGVLRETTNIIGNAAKGWSFKTGRGKKK